MPVSSSGVENRKKLLNYHFSTPLEVAQTNNNTKIKNTLKNTRIKDGQFK